jgi:hypothetical protein
MQSLNLFISQISMKNRFFVNHRSAHFVNKITANLYQFWLAKRPSCVCHPIDNQPRIRHNQLETDHPRSTQLVHRPAGVDHFR